MTPYHDDGQMRLYHGDCVDVMESLDAASFDSIVTDPPYGLGFMGKEWDNFTPGLVSRLEASRDRKTSTRSARYEAYPSKMGRAVQGAGVAVQYDETPAGHRRFQTWCETWAEQALRVAKPGAHMVVFGSPRTYHRLACGIEDAGWEIRDGLQWLFGSGFPKSLNLAGEWDGWGTALKPGYEPIVLARKPLEGTVATNIARHGVGALNIDGCRIEAGDPVVTMNHSETGAARGYEGGLKGGHRGDTQAVGRWPANVILDEETAAQLDAAAGYRRSGFMAAGTHRDGIGYHGALGDTVRNDTYGDGGGPSRFFYTGKARRSEREAFLGDLPETVRGDGRRAVDGPGGNNPRLRTSRRRNHHPTVKPVSVMRWLCRLITPPGGLLLDPFLGSGTTGIAAKAEGFRFVGVEREAEYLEIAVRRCGQMSLELTGAAQ